MSEIATFADRMMQKMEGRGEFKGLALLAVTGLFAAVCLMVIGAIALAFVAYTTEDSACSRS